jgi:hypothetical protein
MGELVAKNILKFITSGALIGVGMGWLVTLVSRNVLVVFMVVTLGLMVGVILGIVHRPIKMLS